MAEGRERSTGCVKHGIQLNTTPSRKHRAREDGWGHLSGDAAVLVEIVQIEGPVEFVRDGAPQNDGQTYNKVLQQEQKKTSAMTDIRKVVATSEAGSHLLEMKAGDGQHLG